MSLFEEKLERIAELEQKTLELGMQMVPEGENIYLADMTLFIGAIKRTLAHCAGFRAMMREKNFICAASILRMQIDTSLRIFGSSLVDDVNRYAEAILDGERISKIKSRTGKPLFDGYLVEELAKQFPWVKGIYDETSGFIHLSRRHWWMAIHRADDDTRVVHFECAPRDVKRPDADYAEILDAFISSTELIHGLISAWTAHKKNHPRSRRPDPG